MHTYVVTGASRGLGLAFSKQLLAKGNTVIALARDPDKSEGLKALAHKNLYLVKADLSDVASLEKAASEVDKYTGGAIDVLINNAGYQNSPSAFTSIDKFADASTMVNDFNAHWNTNVIGTLLATNAFLPLLKKGQLKKIMTLSTGFGDVDFNLQAEIGYQAAYSVSKAALQMAIAKYAMALKDEGFTFFAISPGMVNTATEAPPQEAMGAIMAMMQSFKKAYPDWEGKPIEPAESVTKMLEILDTISMEDNGKMVSVFGGQQWL